MGRTRTYAFSAILILIFGAAPIAHAQTFSVLATFGTTSVAPLNPGSPGVIAQGRDGNLYSTTSNGGTYGFGTVFKISPSGKLEVLYNFDGTHGQAPLGGLTLGTDGNFYGTTWYGGAYGSGTIFKITPSGKLTVLYSFVEFSSDSGFQPSAPPIEGKDGNWYGTAEYGGNNGAGTVYKFTPSGQFTALHEFGGSDGSDPVAPLVQGANDDFYGTTELGGTVNDGEVFRITSSGAFKVLSGFDGAGNGGNPYSPVIQATDGDFFGTASGWGSSEWGTIYKLTPAGIITNLYNFNGNSDGGGPYAGLVQATDGNLYGAGSGGGFNHGSIYRITESGNFSVLYDFDGTSGSDPTVALVQHTDGLLYGDTTCGGTGATGGCVYGPGGGVFYSFDIGLGPFIRFLRDSGLAGDTIEFLGQGFTSSTTVSFGTAKSSTVTVPTQYTGHYLTATVPKGATTGLVTVTTSGVTLKSNKIFRVIPQINSFSPTSGSVGASVTINGVSLKQTTEVRFDGVPVAKTNIAVKSDTEVVVEVPSGAKTGKIVIATPGGTAMSATNFTVSE